MIKHVSLVVLNLLIDTFNVNKYWSYLCEQEHDVRQEPNRAGVHHHFPDWHFGWAYSELSAKPGVALTVQRYGFAINVSKGFIFHHERNEESRSRAS